MLPSLGFTEILLLGVLALVVVGPKDLPLLLRKLGRWTAKLRGMAQVFRSCFVVLARQAELDELRKEVDALRRTTSDIGRDFRRQVDHVVKDADPTIEKAAEKPKPHDVTHAATEKPVKAIAPPADDVAAPAGEEAEENSEATQEPASPVARSAP
jgi:sec-independent protein translocase protein TatB